MADEVIVDLAEGNAACKIPRLTNDRSYASWKLTVELSTIKYNWDEDTVRLKMISSISPEIGIIRC